MELGRRTRELRYVPSAALRILKTPYSSHDQDKYAVPRIAPSHLQSPNMDDPASPYSLLSINSRIPGTATYYHPPLSRFAQHLDWHNDPVHLDLTRLVRHTETANHCVAAWSSMAKWVEGSKKKAGDPL